MLHKYPQLYVRSSRHFHAWSKGILLVQTVLAGVWIALPHLRPFFKTLFNVRKLTLKRLARALTLSLSPSSSLDKKLDKLTKNKQSFHSVLKKQEQHFQKCYREKKMQPLFEDIQNGKVSSIALFCSHPHLVLEESSNPAIRKMLALSIKHHNHSCLNILQQGVWKTLDQHYKLLMLIMGDKKETKKFLSSNNLQKIFHDIPRCYQYINVLLLGGNLVCLGKMLTFSPFFNTLPKDIQQDITQMSQGNMKATHCFLTSISVLERMNWFTPSSFLRPHPQEGLFYDQICEVYKNKEQQLKLIAITQCLPSLSYNNYNLSLDNIMHRSTMEDNPSKSLSNLKECLKNPPILFSLFDVTKENANRLVDLFHEGLLSPTDFQAWTKRAFSFKRAFKCFIPHLALYYLLYPSVPPLPKYKKMLLGTNNHHSPLATLFIEQKETQHNLQEALKDIIDKKQHEKNQALSAQEASSPPAPRKRRM